MKIPSINRISIKSFNEYLQNARNSNSFSFSVALILMGLIAGVILLGISLIVIYLYGEIPFSNLVQKWSALYFLLYLMAFSILSLARYLKPDLYNVLIFIDSIRKRPYADIITAWVSAIILFIMGNLYLKIGLLASGIFYWTLGIVFVYSRTIPPMKCRENHE